MKKIILILLVIGFTSCATHGLHNKEFYIGCKVMRGE